MEAVLEGLLFLVGDEGLTKDKIKEILEINDEDLEKVVNNLKEEYDKLNRGLTLKVLGNSLKLTTKNEHKKYYEKLVSVENDSTLSQAALETLAIIAYNQPITRVGVDVIRGINSSHIVRKLALKNLIKELGRSDAPGRPILYGVTDDFLDYFGLSDISELPELKEDEEPIETETDLFASKYQELN